MHCSISAGFPIDQTNPVKWVQWPKYYPENRNPYKMKGTQRVNNVVLSKGEGNCLLCMEEGCERHNASLSDCL
jgi:heptosyltransferase III